MEKLKACLEKTISVFNSILCVFGVFFYLTFVVCVMVQVISRNFLPNSPSWTEELARYSFIYMVAFGCAVAVHRHEFVNVEFLHDTLEVRHHHNVNRVIDLLINIALCIFTAFLLVKSVLPFAMIKFPMYSTAMEIPMQYVYFGIVLMFIFLPVSFALEVIMDLLSWNDPVKLDENDAALEAMYDDKKEG